MKKYLIGLFFGVGLMTSVGTTFAAQDIMEVMFAPTKAHENIVDLGADKQDVGDEVFRSSTKIGSKDTQAPLIVRITKFLLRMTIVLSITMILYNGVLWIVESSKGEAVKDAKNNLIYIFVGIALALLSVTLINLVSSIGISSLDPSKVVFTKTDCGPLIDKENERKNKSCGFTSIFGGCSDLQPYHDLYGQNNCENYVPPTTPPPTTPPPPANNGNNTSNNTNDCSNLSTQENGWIKNNCDIDTNNSYCQKYLSSHEKYLLECTQQ